MSCCPFLSHISSKLPSVLFKCYSAYPLHLYSLCYLLLSSFYISNLNLLLYMLTHLFLFCLAPFSLWACPPHFLTLSSSCCSPLCLVIPSTPNSFGFSLAFHFTVSSLRLLQAILDVDLTSAVVCVSSGPGLVGPRPLGVEDGALYPLGFRGAQCLSTALAGLLLQVVLQGGNDVCVCVCVSECLCVLCLFMIHKLISDVHVMQLRSQSLI